MLKYLSEKTFGSVFFLSIRHFFIFYILFKDSIKYRKHFFMKQYLSLKRFFVVITFRLFVFFVFCFLFGILVYFMWPLQNPHSNISSCLANTNTDTTGSRCNSTGTSSFFNGVAKTAQTVMATYLGEMRKTPMKSIIFQSIFMIIIDSEKLSSKPVVGSLAKRNKTSKKRNQNINIKTLLINSAVLLFLLNTLFATRVKDSFVVIQNIKYQVHSKTKFNCNCLSIVQNNSGNKQRMKKKSWNK